MKRLACFLLVALMLVAGSASAGEKDYAAMLEQQKAEGLLHLWDIPFGITIDEFMELAPKVTGLPFKVREENRRPYSCSSYTDPAVSPLPEALGFHFYFVGTEFYSRTFQKDEVDALNRMYWRWEGEFLEDKQELVNYYFDFLAELVEQYGSYEQTGFSVWKANEEPNLQYYALFHEDGTINKGDIVAALNGSEDHVVIEFFWKTALLSLSVPYGKQPLMSFSTQNYPVERKEVGTPVPYSETAKKVE